MTQEKRYQHFITRSIQIHGDLYDYSKVKYKNATTKVTIICKQHGDFDQVPMSHVKGVGCPICAIVTRQNTMLNRYGYKHALQNPTSNNKFKSTMLNRYGVEYASQNLELLNKAKQTLYKNYGVTSPLASDIIKQKVRNTMVDKYGVEYTLQSSILSQKVQTTILEKYGVPNISLLSDIQHKKRLTNIAKYGVPYATQCPIIKKKIQLSNISRFGVDNVMKTSISNILPLIEDYDWLFDQYITQNKTASQIANELGCIWYGTILEYLRKHEIAIKYTHGFSCKCIQWLTQIMDQEGINIQHALNGGEYQIPGTRYKADGYCAETNTIYEFHGDIFHGNPDIFESNEYCHPWSDLTAGELYQKTIEREQDLRKLGYNLIVMWENNWNSYQSNIVGDGYND